LFAGLPPDPAVYFVHSYYAAPTRPASVAAEADYPTPFCAAVWQDNVLATQFHPEKSQDVGLKMLSNFAGL
jgi:glutamine amidotransferase